jgi:hypothetical protein
MDKRIEALARQLERIAANPESSEIAREGARAAEAGKSASDCPYVSEHMMAIWKIGYDSKSRPAA